MIGLLKIFPLWGNDQRWTRAEAAKPLEDLCIHLGERPLDQAVEVVSN